MILKFESIVIAAPGLDPGVDPAIHPLDQDASCEEMDARVKPAHDAA